jgi:vacuolar-type H+-ATPase subunit I/STV1
MKISPNMLSQNNNTRSTNNTTQNVRPQFDVREKSLLTSSFDRSIRGIDNKDEINKFIEKGQKKTEKTEQTQEIKDEIEKLNQRLSEESITSNDFSSSKPVGHLFDSSVANRLKNIRSQGSNTYSIGDLFKEKVDEKVSLRPEDPLEYIRSVVGSSQGSVRKTPSLNFGSLYNPVTSARDILEQRGKYSFYFLKFVFRYF